MSSKSDLRLDWCSHEAAKYAVEHWHYSQRMPAGKNTYIGAWEGGKFIGALVFGLGAGADAESPPLRRARRPPRERRRDQMAVLPAFSGDFFVSPAGDEKASPLRMECSRFSVEESLSLRFTFVPVPSQR